MSGKSLKLFCVLTVVTETGDVGGRSHTLTSAAVGISINFPLCFILTDFFFQFIYGLAASKNGIPSIVVTSASSNSNRNSITRVLRYTVETVCVDVLTVYPSASRTCI